MPGLKAGAAAERLVSSVLLPVESPTGPAGDSLKDGMNCSRSAGMAAWKKPLCPAPRPLLPPASPSHSVAAKPAVGELIPPRSASRQACFPQQLPRLSQSPEVWRPAGHLVSQTAGLASAPAPKSHLPGLVVPFSPDPAPQRQPSPAPPHTVVTGLRRPGVRGGSLGQLSLQPSAGLGHAGTELKPRPKAQVAVAQRGQL